MRTLDLTSESSWHRGGPAAYEVYALRSSANAFVRRGSPICFKAGDPDDLAAKVLWALEKRNEMAELAAATRMEYEHKHQVDTLSRYR